MNRAWSIALSCAALAQWFGPAAIAQTWPTRPITLVVPSTAASTPDTVARLLAQKLSEQIGQQVVAVNRPGAGGNVGSESVARAQPDGYTLLLGSIANTTTPHMMAKLGYQLDELAPVSSVAAAPDLLVVHPDVAARNPQELIAWLKTKAGTPGAIAGPGSTPHLSMELLRRMTGADITIVPHQGGGPLIQNLVGGQIPFGFTTSVTAIPRIKSGQLRALATSSGKRIGSLPDLPTLAESGLPGFDVTAWFGLFVPAKTPTPIVERLADETRKALASQEVRTRLIDLGAEPLGSTPQAFAAYVKDEYEKWGKLIAEAKIQLK